MAKKRKTRQQKIILQLKRELAKQETKTVSDTKQIEPRQGAISVEPKNKPSKLVKEEKTDIPIYSYNPKLIRKDLFKTLILALAILSLQTVLYLRLR